MREESDAAAGFRSRSLRLVTKEAELWEEEDGLRNA